MATVLVGCGSPSFDDPQELADFAVECYRSGEREKLLPYMTEARAENLKQELEKEKEMGKNEDYAKVLSDLREQLDKTTYTCKSSADLGATVKQYSYKSDPKGYNLRVQLEQHDGKWCVDLVAP